MCDHAVIEQALTECAAPTAELRSGMVSGEIPRQFVRQCTNAPHALALCDGHDRWTYEEAFTTSLMLARLLVRSAVGVDDVVVVVAERGAALVIALLGVLFAGARFVVLERGQFNAHAIEVLRGLQPKCWLCLGQGAGVAAELRTGQAVPVYQLPPPRAALQQQLLDDANRLPPLDGCMELPRAVGAQARAYLIWTSGTTSLPKLISTRHGAVVNFLEWYVAEFAITRRDRFSMLSGLAHDPVLRDIFTPLSVGGTLHIPSDSQRLDPDALYTWLADSAVTVVHLTPLMLELLVRTARQPLGSVRLLAFGGDQLTTQHVSCARALCPNAEVVNFYGASETPQAMAFQRAALGAAGTVQAVPVGRGIRGAELLVLNDALRRCAPGEPGEIYIRSAFLAEGYVGLAELTQQRFLRNPLSDDPADRVFKTGDAGVYTADGAVRVIGRRDRQAKINANRIDLDDIELTIAGFAPVAQVAVQLEPCRKQIVAYVVPRPGQSVCSSELRDHLARCGPLHAIPARIELIASLPVTRNGKTDYASLAAAPRLAQRTPTRAAQGEALLELLRNVWMSELGVPALDATHSFYDVGGNSIAAAKIAARIAEQTGLALRAADLFIYPTLPALAAFLLQVDDGSAAAASPHVETAHRRNAVLRAQNRRRRMSG